MENNYNSKAQSRNILYLVCTLGLIILTISWCNKEPKKVVTDPPDNSEDSTTTQISRTPTPPPPGYDLALASLDNSKSFLPDFEVVFQPDYTFKIHPKKGPKTEGEYKIDSHKNIILFNDGSFKDTFRVEYFRYEPGRIKEFHSNRLGRSFSPKNDFPKSEIPSALKQIHLIKWRYSENGHQGFVTLKNYGKTTWDSLAICINGDFYDGHGLLLKKFEKQEHRWPKREFTWAKVNLAPGRSLKINLSESVNPDGERFDHIGFAVTKVYCIGKVTCDGKTITTEPIQLPPEED